MSEEKKEFPPGMHIYCSWIDVFAFIFRVYPDTSACSNSLLHPRTSASMSTPPACFAIYYFLNHAATYPRRITPSWLPCTLNFLNYLLLLASWYHCTPQISWSEFCHRYNIMYYNNGINCFKRNNYAHLILCRHVATVMRDSCLKLKHPHVKQKHSIWYP